MVIVCFSFISCKNLVLPAERRRFWKNRNKKRKIRTAFQLKKGNKLLSFLAIYFFFCCSCFCFHGVCFSLSVSMLAWFLVFFVFVLCFVFVLLLVLLSFNEKCFPCNFGVFFELCCFKRVVWFLCFMFSFLFVFLVLFVSIL